MALPISGALSFSAINTELQLAAEATLSASSIQNSILIGQDKSITRANLSGLIFFKGYYYAVPKATEATGLLRRSADLILWEVVDTGLASISKLVCTTDHLFALESGFTHKSVRISQDGLSWSTSEVHIPASSYTISQIYATSSTCVIASSAGSTDFNISIKYSINTSGAISWGSFTISFSGSYTSFSIRSVIYNGTDGVVTYTVTNATNTYLNSSRFSTSGAVGVPSLVFGSPLADLSTRPLQFDPVSQKFYCTVTSGSNTYVVTADLSSGISWSSTYDPTFSDYKLIPVPPINISGTYTYMFLNNTTGLLCTASSLGGPITQIAYSTDFTYGIEKVGDYLFGISVRGGGGTQLYYSPNSITAIISKASAYTNVHSLPLSKLYGKYAELTLTHAETYSDKLNLRTWALANGWNGLAKLKVINSSFIISSDPATPALTVSGSFPNGLTLENNGYIEGCGGFGGNGAGTGTGTAGGTGGAALYVTSACTVNNNGYIRAGGGGGGGGRAAKGSFGSTTLGGGGGGGGRTAGYTFSGFGSAGASSGSGVTAATSAWVGTHDNPGAGGIGAKSSGSFQAGAGGTGGEWGVAGAAGTTYVSSSSTSVNPATAGGAGGSAVSGNSYITWGATGTRIGAIV